MTSRYKVIRSDGHTFVFAYDEVAPDLLHIFARHLMHPHQAIDVFFEGEVDVYNQEFDRHETRYERFVLYWCWINEERKVVLVITCFEGEDDE